MIRKENLALCSIRELAHELAKTVDKKSLRDSRFTDCDFSIIDNDEQTDDLEYVRSGASGWYGIKKIDTGFDSQDLILVCDYYGGGSPALIHIWNDDGDRVRYEHDILDGLLGCLNTREIAEQETVLIVDFL